MLYKYLSTWQIQILLLAKFAFASGIFFFNIFNVWFVESVDAEPTDMEGQLFCNRENSLMKSKRTFLNRDTYASLERTKSCKVG